MTRTICTKCTEPVVSGGLCRKHYDKKRYADRGLEIIRDGVPTPRLSQIAVGAVRPNKYEVRSMALELARSRRGLTDAERVELLECRKAQQPAQFVPDGLRLALSNAGIAAPESDEALHATCEQYVQMLVTWVKERKPFKIPEAADREMLKRLAVILSGSDAPGEIKALTVTAQSFVDRYKLLSKERDALRNTAGNCHEPSDR